MSDTNNKDTFDISTEQVGPIQGQTSTLLTSNQNITPGYKTSSGQLTFVFTLIALLLSYLGYNKISAGQIDTIYQAITNLIEAIGPIIVAVPVLINYVTNRHNLATEVVKQTGQAQIAAQENQVDSSSHIQPIGGFGSLGRIVGRAVSTTDTVHDYLLRIEALERKVAMLYAALNTKDKAG